MKTAEILIGPVTYPSTIEAPCWFSNSLHEHANDIYVEPVIKSEPTIDDFETEFCIKSEPESPSSYIDVTIHKVTKFRQAVESEVEIPDFQLPADSFDLWSDELVDPGLLPDSPPCKTIETTSTPPPQLPPSLPSSPCPSLRPSLPTPPPPPLPSAPPSLPSPPSRASPIIVAPIPENSVSRETSIRFVSPQLNSIPPSNRFGNRKNPGRRKSDTWACEVAACDKRFSNKRRYEQHLSKEHKCKTAICTDCGKSLGRKDYMRDHIRSKKHLFAIATGKRPATAKAPT
ncbi:hypothetical protein TWF696_000282 [Orbilia brochopaga]|uniref:C2H2-type domain-containing protein n=1 Tax=Orbilia brochopaga TaxID=3140254 RepID=A0AAV9VAT4_9PEZI